MGVITTPEIDGHGITLPDPSGGRFNAAGNFDWLLWFASSLPVLGRIDEYGDVRFSSAELLSVGKEATGLLDLARDGPERRGLMRLITLASYGSQRPGSVLRVLGD